MSIPCLPPQDLTIDYSDFSLPGSVLIDRADGSRGDRLAQWEGISRKWYYVQRATGKSQWELPTEPVILTPSTTPTSTGTGPSQAPFSRPQTNSPQIGPEPGGMVTDGNYTGADRPGHAVVGRTSLCVRAG